jgi:tetratricopeptide (TPR) repeat protein
MNRSRSGIRRIPIAAVLLLGLSQLACRHGAGKATPPEAVPGADQRLVDQMEKMRARALKAPGGALEASDFAFHVTMLFTQGVADRRSVSTSLVDEAVGCLDKAIAAKPDDSADLLARKGELLLAAGRSDLGVSALRASVDARPNLRAFTSLTKQFTAQKQTAEIEALCKKTLPGMTSDSSRYAVLDECLKASGAATPEAGLRWAAKADVKFYLARKRELEARLAAAQAKDESTKDGKGKDEKSKSKKKRK